MSGFGGYGKGRTAARENYARNCYAPDLRRISDQKLLDYHASNLTHAPDLAAVTVAELARRGLDAPRENPRKQRVPKLG